MKDVFKHDTETHTHNYIRDFSKDQWKFTYALRHFPYAKSLVAIKDGKYTYDVNKVEKFLGVASSGEAHMMRFICGVIDGKNTYNFDIFEAAPSMRKIDENLIFDWIQKPYFV